MGSPVLKETIDLLERMCQPRMRPLWPRSKTSFCSSHFSLFSVNSGSFFVVFFLIPSAVDPPGIHQFLFKKLLLFSLWFHRPTTLVSFFLQSTVSLEKIDGRRRMDGNRDDEARRVLQRIRGTSDVDDEFDSIHQSVEETEREIKVGGANLLESRSQRRRIRSIVIGV